MDSVKDDFLSISKIINHEIHKRKKKTKDKVSTTITLENSKYDELNTLLKKKKKKKKSKTLTQETIISSKTKLNTKTCDGYNKSMEKTKTGATNSYKSQSTSPISNVNASEELTLKKKKKKKKKNKKMIQNSENLMSNKTTFNTEKSCLTLTNEDIEVYSFSLNERKKKVHKTNKTVISNNRMISSENDKDALSLTNTEGKKKKKDCEVQNTNNSENDVAVFPSKERNYSQINECYDLLSEHNKHKKKNSSDDDDGYTSLLKMMFKRMKKKKKKSETLTPVTTITPKKKLNTKPCVEYDKTIEKVKTGANYSNIDETAIPISNVNASEDNKELTLVKKKGKKKKKKKDSKDHIIGYLENDNAVVHTEKRNCSQINDCFELVSDLNKHKKSIKDHQGKKKKKEHSKRAAKEKTESLKEVTKLKRSKMMEYLKNYISEDHTEEMYNDTTLVTTTSKDDEKDSLIFNKSKKKKKKKTDIKVVTCAEITSTRKSKKLKRQSTHKECLENDSSQTVPVDKEINRSDGYVCEDSKNNFEFLFAENSDKTKEHLVNVKGRESCRNNVIKKSNKCKRQTTLKECLEIDLPQQSDMNKKTRGMKTFVSEDSKKIFQFSFAWDGRKTKANNGNNESPNLRKFCLYEFKNYCSLSSHKIVHTGKISLDCDVCSKTFTYRSELCRHYRTHTGERPYSCDVCGRSFSQRPTLVNHIRTHTGVKPYSCDVCGRSFSEKSTLVKHYRTHTGERPYDCGVCEKSFATTSGRTSHTRKIHDSCF